MDATRRPYADVLDKLRKARLRPTRQRLALAKLLFSAEDRHVTAETLHKEALTNRVRVSLATVYNTLHQFTQAGLLREVVVDPTRSYFDTNTSRHHHFYWEDGHDLADIPDQAFKIGALPPAPDGTEIVGVDVVVRLRRKPD